MYEPGLSVNIVFTYHVFTERVEKNFLKELAILQQN